MPILNIYLIMSRSKKVSPALRVWEWTGFAYKHEEDARMLCSSPYDRERFEYMVHECAINMPRAKEDASF